MCKHFVITYFLQWACIVLIAGVCRRLSSVVVVCRLLSYVTLPAGGRSGRRARGRSGRSTLHVGPVVLRPVRATPCLKSNPAASNLYEISLRMTNNNRNIDLPKMNKPNHASKLSRNLTCISYNRKSRREQVILTERIDRSLTSIQPKSIEMTKR